MAARAFVESMLKLFKKKEADENDELPDKSASQSKKPKYNSKSLQKNYWARRSQRRKFKIPEHDNKSRKKTDWIRGSQRRKSMSLKVIKSTNEKKKDSREDNSQGWRSQMETASTITRGNSIRRSEDSAYGSFRRKSWRRKKTNHQPNKDGEVRPQATFNVEHDAESDTSGLDAKGLVKPEDKQKPFAVAIHFDDEEEILDDTLVASMVQNYERRHDFQERPTMKEATVATDVLLPSSEDQVPVMTDVDVTSCTPQKSRDHASSGDPDSDSAEMTEKVTVAKKAQTEDTCEQDIPNLTDDVQNQTPLKEGVSTELNLTENGADSSPTKIKDRLHDEGDGASTTAEPWIADQTSHDVPELIDTDNDQPPLTVGDYIQRILATQTEVYDLLGSTEALPEGVIEGISTPPEGKWAFTSSPPQTESTIEHETGHSSYSSEELCLMDLPFPHDEQFINNPMKESLTEGLTAATLSTQCDIISAPIDIPEKIGAKIETFTSTETRQETEAEQELVALKEKSEKQDRKIAELEEKVDMLIKYIQNGQVWV